MSIRLEPCKRPGLLLILAVAALALESIILDRARKPSAEPEFRPKTVPSSYPRPAPSTNRVMWVMGKRSNDRSLSLNISYDAASTLFTNLE